MAPLPRWYPRLPPRVLDLTLDLDGCWPTPAADVAVTRELVTTAFSLSSVFAAPSTLPHRLPQPLLPVCTSPSAVGPSPPHRPAPMAVAALPPTNTAASSCLCPYVSIWMPMQAVWPPLSKADATTLSCGRSGSTILFPLSDGRWYEAVGLSLRPLGVCAGGGGCSELQPPSPTASHAPFLLVNRCWDGEIISLTSFQCSFCSSGSQ
jgi:hypothetical protein